MYTVGRKKKYQKPSSYGIPVYYAIFFHSHINRKYIITRAGCFKILLTDAERNHNLINFYDSVMHTYSEASTRPKQYSEFIKIMNYE